MRDSGSERLLVLVGSPSCSIEGTAFHLRSSGFSLISLTERGNSQSLRLWICRMSLHEESTSV